MFFVFIIVGFVRGEFLQNITAMIGHPLVISCPFFSTPTANFTWFFNKMPINFTTIDPNNRRVKGLFYF